MAHPSKRKGNRFERELREAFEEAGLRAERAWASNGSALTTDGGEQCAEGVDLLVEGGLKVQAKRRASVAQYLSPPEGAHLTIVREDRAEALCVLPLPLLLRLLRGAYEDAAAD
jgi:8-oxo-dGTP pyrophosphatase MutT (NUDIX family)